MATTPRKTQTPGAKKETTTTAQTSTDDVMDAVLGKADAVKEAPEGFISLEQFDAVAAQLANKEEQLKGVTAELVATRKQVVKLTGGQNQQPTTQVVVPVRKKPVLTAKGWSVED